MNLAAIITLVAAQTSQPSASPIQMVGFYYQEVTQRVRGRNDLSPLSRWNIILRFPKTMEGQLLEELKDGFRVAIMEVGPSNRKLGLYTGTPIPKISDGRIDFVSKGSVAGSSEPAELAGASIFTWWDDRTEIGIVGDRGSSSKSELLANIYLGIDGRRQELQNLFPSTKVWTDAYEIPLPSRDMPSKFAVVIEGKTKRYTMPFTVKASAHTASWNDLLTFKAANGGSATGLNTETRINVYSFMQDWLKPGPARANAKMTVEALPAN